jgi:lipoprotein-anchoring transpeptidase ErfK/SrfK
MSPSNEGEHDMSKINSIRILAAACGMALCASGAQAFDLGFLPANLFPTTAVNYSTDAGREVAPTRTIVDDPTGERAGAITIDTKTRYLYLSLDGGKAIRYGVGVGREGFGWQGRAYVGRRAEWPNWTPPAEMLKRRPDLPTFMEGGIENPLGARALYLYSGHGDTLYRIHGTNEPDSIGKAVSSGCIRMLNDDVADLYERVKLGTRVNVI